MAFALLELWLLVQSSREPLDLSHHLRELLLVLKLTVHPKRKTTAISMLFELLPLLGLFDSDLTCKVSLWNIFIIFLCNSILTLIELFSLDGFHLKLPVKCMNS